MDDGEVRHKHRAEGAAKDQRGGGGARAVVAAHEERQRVERLLLVSPAGYVSEQDIRERARRLDSLRAG